MDGEAYPGSSDQEASRPPDKTDLSRICAELNRLGAKYVVVGGFAVIEAGYPRFTGDIDFLIDPSLENEARVFEALRVLSDKAVNQVDAGDVGKFTVVRIADEVLVDLMANACGVDFSQAIADAQFKTVNNVNIPFASPKTLLRMKQTVRAKDVGDRLFLEGLIGDLLKDEKPKGFWESLRDELTGKKQKE
jgi:hypothetical protein